MLGYLTKVIIKSSDANMVSHILEKENKTLALSILSRLDFLQ